MPKIPRSASIGKSIGVRMALSRQKDINKEEIKYSDYMKLEKMRKFKRLPRLVDKRSPVKFTCPNCSRDGQTQTNYELTGTQFCCCITMCWLGCYCCCLPFCCCKMYNVKHSCPKCYYQLGESGK